jgi:hypothetical protein
MRKSAALVAAAALAIVAAGCGSSSSSTGANATKPVDPNAHEVSPAGDIPDDQAYVAYAPPGAGFGVKVPEGWSRSSAGGAVTFTDKLNAIRIDSAPAHAPLTVARAKRTEVARLATSVKGYEPGTLSAVSRKAGSAVRITYLAAAKPNPVTGRAGTDAVERYVFFHEGKQAILTLSGPEGADNVDPWRIVTDSLTWTR